MVFLEVFYKKRLLGVSTVITLFMMGPVPHAKTAIAAAIMCTSCRWRTERDKDEITNQQTSNQSARSKCHLRETPVRRQ